MRRAVTAMAVFSMLWLAPLPSAQAVPGATTTIYSALVGDPPVAGSPTDLHAVLGSGPDPVPGQQLTLSVRPYGSSTFTEVGVAVTDAEGGATVWVTLARTSMVRWSFAGVENEYDSSTLEYPVPVATRVSRRVNDRTLRRHQRLVVRGGTFPAKPGCVVKLWRGELRPLVVGPRPVRLAVSRVHSDGTYRLRHRFRKSGRMRVAVTVAPCAGNSRGLSRYVRIRVR